MTRKYNVQTSYAPSTPEEWVIVVDPDQTPDQWNRVWFTAYWQPERFSRIVAQRIQADLEKFVKGHPRQWPVRVVYA